jgi:hypothetical protein
MRLPVSEMVEYHRVRSNGWLDLWTLNVRRACRGALEDIDHDGEFSRGSAPASASVGGWLTVKLVHPPP